MKGIENLHDLTASQIDIAFTQFDIAQFIAQTNTNDSLFEREKNIVKNNSKIVPYASVL